MTPRRRARTGTRRDGGVRRIHAHEVRYPGLSLPLPTDNPDASVGLKPARDTGMAIAGRAAREARRRSRTRRQLVIAGAVILGMTVVLATGWKVSSDRLARVRERTAAEASAYPHRTGVAPETAGAAVIRALTRRAPTPYFARYKKLKLRLPVSAQDVTEIGFHQASYDYALHMKSLLPYADAENAKDGRGTGRDVSKQSADRDAILVGEALKMWRNRPGKPDTAVDCGANPGALVYAPVDGTVVKIKEIDLYGKYPDVELHIQPRGHPELDVVLLHIDQVTVRPGDKVIAGETPLARIRDLDKRIGPQLKSYTRNGGTHTHVQVNDTTARSYKGLKGAIRVDADGNVVTSSAQ